MAPWPSVAPGSAVWRPDMGKDAHATSLGPLGGLDLGEGGLAGAFLDLALRVAGAVATWLASLRL